MDASRERDLQTQANELYWSSDASVNQIAEDLDLSKGALYELIRGLPVGLPCPRCSTEMEYSNRTARDKAYVSCPACGFEVDEEQVEGGTDGRAESLEAAPPARRPEELLGEQALIRLLAGSALLGLAAGVAITLTFRGRRR